MIQSNISNDKCSEECVIALQPELDTVRYQQPLLLSLNIIITTLVNVSGNEVLKYQIT